MTNALVSGIETKYTPPISKVADLGALELNDKSELSKCSSDEGSAPYKSKEILRLYPVKPTGGLSSDFIKKSPKYRIRYHSGGIEFRNSCIANQRLKNVDNYISSLVLQYPHLYTDTEDSLLIAYKEHMTQLLSEPRAIGKIIDSCFQQTIQRWNKCRGRFSRTAKKVYRERNKLRVQVMPSAFLVKYTTGGLNTWAAGASMTDMRSIFTMISTIGGNRSGAPFIHSLESLVCWEMGNTFGMHMNYYPTTLKGEIGFQSPCYVLRK